MFECYWIRKKKECGKKKSKLKFLLIKMTFAYFCDHCTVLRYLYKQNFRNSMLNYCMCVCMCVCFQRPASSEHGCWRSGEGHGSSDSCADLLCWSVKVKTLSASGHIGTYLRALCWGTYTYTDQERERVCAWNKQRWKKRNMHYYVAMEASTHTLEII